MPMISLSNEARAEPASYPLDHIALSALQHWAYCPRQCGLIHLEQAFDDNVHTLRGQAVHARVDKPGVELARGVRVERIAVRPSAMTGADCMTRAARVGASRSVRTITNLLRQAQNSPPVG